MDGRKASFILAALGAAIAIPVSLVCLNDGGDEEALDDVRSWFDSRWGGTN